MATALITGASSGIGEVFAKKLATRGYDLVLVARSQDKLNSLGVTLSEQYGISAIAIVQDLTDPDAAANLFAQLEERSITIDMLVNNAGFGVYGEFADGSRESYLDMIQLNIKVLVDLSHRCLQGMKIRRSGSILNISSTAAFQPIPYFAVYAATKSFVLSFSEALWYECKSYGVKVIGVCPGPTETAFFKVADFPSSMENGIGQDYTSPEAVVEDALQALDQQVSNVVTGGFRNQLLVNASRFLPRETLTSAVGRLFKGD